MFQAIILCNLKVNWEKMVKTLILGLILARFDQNLVPKIFLVGFTSTRCYTLLQAILVCSLKEN